MEKIKFKALTYDDVLLLPRYSDFTPKEASLRTPNEYRSGFVLHPCANSTALRWLRAILHKANVDQSLIADLTLASFRVTILDLAYQCQVPSSVRICLGR